VKSGKTTSIYAACASMLFALALTGCGGDSNDSQPSASAPVPAPPAPPAPAPADPLAQALMPDYPDVVGEYVQIEGGAQSTDPNVLQTPKEFNAATFLRVRSALDGETPRAANAVIVAMPGFSSTPGHWMYLAAQLVHKANEKKNGCVDGTTPIDCRLEVWVVQRRGAHLADTLGARNAIVNKDPAAAVNYYFGKSIMGSDGRTALDGRGKFPAGNPKSFVGAVDATWRPLQQSDLYFMADWGFEAYARDVENMISLVSQKAGSRNVFLAGHSQGGSFTTVFAGRKGTNGRRGYEDLAGIVMLDGGGYGSSITGPTQTQIDTFQTAIDDFRSGVRPVYTDATGGNTVSGPAAGARDLSSARFSTEGQQVESLFPPRQAGMIAFPGTAADTANAFLGAIRLTQVARAGMSFDTSPTTTASTPTPLAVNLQDTLIVGLGESLGLLDFTPVAGKENDCDIIASGTNAGKCVPLVSQIDPNKVYGWREAGGGSTIPTNVKVGVGKASQFLRGYAWTTNRTNIQPITYNFRASGLRTVDAREIVAANWYPSERYETEMTFVGSGPIVALDYKGVKIDIDKSVVKVPLYYAHQNVVVATNPGVFPLVTDYTNIGSTGTVQSDEAKAKSPIDPAINSKYYKHTDFVSSDDSLSGKPGAPAPGEPGVSLVANTLVDWVIARTGSKLAEVPSPKDLGVVNSR